MIRLTLLLLVVILLQARRIRPSHHIIDDLKQYFGKMLGGNQGNTPQVAAPTNTAQEASNTNTFQNLINQVKGTNEPLTGNSIMSYFINKNGIGGGSAPSGPSGPSGQFDQSGPPQNYDSGPSAPSTPAAPPTTNPGQNKVSDAINGVVNLLNGNREAGISGLVSAIYHV